MSFRAVVISSLILSLGMNSAAIAENPTLPLAQQKVWKDWSYSLALQAATWGAPLVIMYALRYNDTVGPKAKAKPNAIWRMENISTPELSKQAGYVTPNVNTIYGFGFMDLRQEPVILEVPNSHDRYYLVQLVDMWTNSFAYVGGKATGYKGGKFALVGPGWKGQLPKNVKRIDCPTPWILVQPRVHIFKNGKLSLEGARDILQQIRTIGLAKYNGKKPIASVNYLYPAPQFSDPNLPVSALSYKDPLQFWDLLSIALSENPPPTDQITALLPMFKSLGIEFGKPWDRSKVPPEVLAAMSDAAKNIGDMLSNLPMGTIYKGAFIPPPSIGNPKNDYKTRAIVARVGLTANIPEEAIYWIYTQDSQYQFLNGSHKYTMTFREGLPFYAPGFWSVTMYDSKNNYTVPNPLKRYMLGSDTPKIKKNADGSFTLYIQTQNPGKDKESNWLPAPPGQFYLIPRAYPPKPELIKVLTDVNAWPVPVVIQQAK